MRTQSNLVLLTNLPAPYRVPVWNHLAYLTRGNLEVRFIAPSDARRRTWTVPAGDMHFRWEFLAYGPKGGVSAPRFTGTGSDNWLSGPEAMLLQGLKPNLSNGLSGGVGAPPFEPTALKQRHRFLPAALIELRAAFAMLPFLLRRRPSAVICGGYNSLAAWVTFAWCRMARRRFVLWLEGTTRDLRPRGRLRTWLKKLIVGRADAIAASGKATVECVWALGARENNIFLAPFGGDHRWFAREAATVDAAAEKKRRGYPARLALYSGRVVREKGVMVLLEAFRSLQIPDAGLLVVGDGPARAEMEHFCRCWKVPRVFFAGAQDYPLMPHFYALADVLALPTFSDQWGFVVNEAFACGVPAIVSRVAGVCDDLIVEGETGFTVEPGDARELAAKIRLLLTDDRLRSRMSANCRCAVLPYSAEACAAGLLAAAEGRGQKVQVRSQESEARSQKPEGGSF